MRVALETGWRGQVDGLGLPRPKNFTSRDKNHSSDEAARKLEHYQF